MCQTMEATSADLESWVGKEKVVDGREVAVEVKSVSESAESVTAVQRSGYQKQTLGQGRIIKVKGMGKLGCVDSVAEHTSHGNVLHMDRYA